MDVNELTRLLNEARAELAKVQANLYSARCALTDWHTAHDLMRDERDALRAAVEKHNAKMRNVQFTINNVYAGTPDCMDVFLIPLPPYPAPAASEPMQDLTRESKDLGLYAAPEAGPKRDFCCIDSLEAAKARAWRSRNTRCGCDHNESCAERFPPAFHMGGYWDQQRASLQQTNALCPECEGPAYLMPCPHCAAPSPAQPEGGK